MDDDANALIRDDNDTGFVEDADRNEPYTNCGGPAHHNSGSTLGRRGGYNDADFEENGDEGIFNHGENDTGCVEDGDHNGEDNERVIKAKERNNASWSVYENAQSILTGNINANDMSISILRSFALPCQIFVGVSA